MVGQITQCKRDFTRIFHKKNRYPFKTITANNKTTCAIDHKTGVERVLDSIQKLCKCSINTIILEVIKKCDCILWEKKRWSHSTLALLCWTECCNLSFLGYKNTTTKNKNSFVVCFLCTALGLYRSRDLILTANFLTWIVIKNLWPTTFFYIYRWLLNWNTKSIYY